MERLEIAYSRKFIQSLDSQLNILFHQKIVDRIDWAEELIEKVYNFVPKNIDNAVESPEKLTVSGKKYMRYMINEDWTWFIFFNQEGSKVIITHLLNNQSTEHSGL